jgi:transcriptional regulator of NAD metabolism
MEKMDGKIRRDHIIEILKNEQDAISGSALAKLMGVSRQVIVQDITLLRTAYPILATARGYLLYPTQEKKCRRTFCVKHGMEQTRDELNRIVDLGGKVLDVMVEHDIYGQIRADLMLSRRKEVAEFCEKLENSRSGPLNIMGSGVHYHTVEAENETVLEEIEKSLELYLI